MRKPIFSQIHNAEELLTLHRELGERLLRFGAADVDAAYMELKKDFQQLHAKVCNLERRIETLENECMMFSTREERWEVQTENKLHQEERRDWLEDNSVYDIFVSVGQVCLLSFYIYVLNRFYIWFYI